MRSDIIKKGFARAPRRGLLRATGQIRDDDEIQARLDALPPSNGRSRRKWLRRYAAQVTSAKTGAVLADPGASLPSR